MKWNSLLIASAGLSLAGTATAQTPVVDAGTAAAIANQTGVMQTGQSDISAKLSQILAEAQKQNQQLEEQLNRIGDPAAINSAAIATIQEDIAQSATSLKTREEQLAMMQAIDGSEVFDDTGFGVMEAIGSTVTREDGSVVDRDPERYRMEAAQLAHVKEYKRVRQAALERKQALNQELAQVIEDLNNAQDLATIQKLQGMITALEGQLAECNATIMVAQADSEMTLKELEGQARVITKAKQEEVTLKNPRTGGTNPSSVTGFPSPNGSGSYKLPWGRKGTENNPGTGSDGGENGGSP